MVTWTALDSTAAFLFRVTLNFFEKCTLNDISKEANKRETNKLKKVFFSAKIIYATLVPLFLVQQTLVE